MTTYKGSGWHSYTMVRDSTILRLINPITNKRHKAATRKLLETLSAKELSILDNLPRLLAKIEQIAKMEVSDLQTLLKSKYQFDIVTHNEDDFYVDPGRIENTFRGYLPEWTHKLHLGFYLESTEQLRDFAREFLLQEVRVNLWTRYFQHKKDPRTRAEGEKIGTSWSAGYI